MKKKTIKLAKNTYKRTCSDCRKKFTAEKMIYGPDPYCEEIHGDMTPVWLCHNCYDESCRDI
jgi:hypothetical protein